MAIPEKREDLIALGYEFNGDGECRGCGEPIEWWITPNDKKMPVTVKEVRDESKGAFAPVERYIRVPHWKECPNADDFRKPKS